VHPVAPAALKEDPLTQVSQFVFPPIENVPASQNNVPVLVGSGIDPAGADEQEKDLSELLYWPSKLQSVQISTPPDDAVPARHSTAPVLVGFVLYPALTVMQ
jgi:hypothetical protein